MLFSVQRQLDKEKQASIDLGQQLNHLQSKLHQAHQRLWQKQIQQQQQQGIRQNDILAQQGRSTDTSSGSKLCPGEDDQTIG